MRILVVQESNWVEKGPHQSHHLMERLTQRGHEVKVIDFDILWRYKSVRKTFAHRQEFKCASKTGRCHDTVVVRPAIIQLPVLEYLSLLYSHWREISRQMKEFTPDIVVGFGLLNASISIRATRGRGVPFIYYVIDELHRLVPQSVFRPLARAVEKHNMASATCVITINEGLREYAIRMGAFPNRTMVVRAGVELKKFDEWTSERNRVRRHYGFSEDDIVLFYMGWLYEFSGICEVACDLAKKGQNRQNLKLLVIGAGPVWTKLQDLKQKSELTDEIILSQWLPYEEACKHISASDVCILPAQKDPIMENIVPIKMYEYMASRKPVVATKLPGLLKEFGTGNGVIYVEGPHEVLDKVYDMMRNGVIKSEGEKSREFVRKSDWETITDDFERMLGTYAHEPTDKREPQPGNDDRHAKLSIETDGR